ncbi:MAG: hypothetical protein JWQ07_4326 [Ramlibacter sp.]|nr:hypothetical protein [Ramlibacter sp.]
MLKKYLVVLLLFALLAGCGGGSGTPEAVTVAGPPPTAVIAASRAPALSAASSAVTPEEAARQLMNFGESVYPEYFPGHPTTQSLPPFVYRYYPQTGTYLGVVVTDGSGYALNGVYVMGGTFGNAPLYVGPLSQFITPIGGVQALTFVQGPSGVINDPTIPLGSPPGNVWIQSSADLKGDGKRDLILGMGINPLSATEPGAVRILRPNAAGTGLLDVTRQLLGQGSLPSTFGASQIAVGDFNRDGKFDIFIAEGGIDRPPLGGGRNVLLVSNGDGTYSDRSSTLPTVPDSSSSAAVGDVNGDGIPDLFVNNTPLPTRSYFLIGKGDGTFEQATDRLPADVSVPNGAGFDSAILVDLDGDGSPDLVMGSVDGVGGRNIVLYNDGRGNFAIRARVNLPLGSFGANARNNGILALDINGDGKMDLLILSTQTGALQDVGAAAQVLINQGNGVFVDATAGTLGSSATRVNGVFWDRLVAADINGDGRLDFYATGTQKLDDNGVVSLSIPMIWLNNGDGTFTSVNSDIFPNVPSRLEVMDVDGDGQLDFVTVSVGGAGEIGYRTFLNRTPRSVPGEPIIGTSFAANGQASISFSAPLGTGPSPITGYTATCSAGAQSGAGAASASPITVSGLTNGKSYSCTVRAASAAGSGLPSAAVLVKPQP